MGWGGTGDQPGTSPTAATAWDGTAAATKQWPVRRLQVRRLPQLRGGGTEGGRLEGTAARQAAVASPATAWATLARSATARLSHAYGRRVRWLPWPRYGGG